MPVHARPLTAMLAVVALSFGLLVEPGQAQQIPPPPAFIFGSINDADGPIPEGVTVEAIVNDNVCGTTETLYTGDGDARVTVYAVDVVAHGQTEGCGRPGDSVRLRVGDRIAPGSIPWETGVPIRNDIVFGDTTPAPIPTFTPTPDGAAAATPTPAQAQQTPATEEATPTPAAATDDDSDTATPQPGDDEVAGGDTTQDDTAENGLEGQLTSATPGQEAAAASAGNGGGMPVWAVLLLVVGGIAVAGGGIGYVMARGTRKPGEPGAENDAYAYDGDAFATGGEYDDGAAYAGESGYDDDDSIIGGYDDIDHTGDDDRIG